MSRLEKMLKRYAEMKLVKKEEERKKKSLYGTKKYWENRYAENDGDSTTEWYIQASNMVLISFLIVDIVVFYGIISVSIF